MRPSINKKTFARFSEIKLDSLLEVTKAINSNFSVDDLLELFKDVLQDKLKISKLILFINNHDGWKCALKFGVGEEYKEINIEQELLPIKEIHAVNYSNNTPIDFNEPSRNHLFEIVIPVFHKTEPLAYLLIGDSEENLEVISPSLKHLNFVQTLTNIIVVAIENKKLAKENLHQAAVKRELELASQMQAMLFPARLPNNQVINSAAYYLPHQQVGGDYYDFIQLNEQESVFCVADVSGKGVAAALLMANFQANLRVLLKHTTSLTELVSQLNKKVNENTNGEKFITFFVARYHLQTRELTYINAAHNPPLLVTNDDVTILKACCVGLGMFEEITELEQKKIILPPGAVIVCYTDGLTDLEDNQGIDFGIEKLKDIVRSKKDLTMEELNKFIMEKVLAYKQDQPFVDDIALFSIKLF